MIAGVDLSTHAIDVVLLDDDEDRAEWFRARLDEADSVKAARSVRDLMPARTAWHDRGVVAIGIEDPFSKGLKTVKALARIEGALLACIPPEIPIYRIAPTSWKKRFTGRGDTEKQQVRELARRFFDEDARLRLDTTDALGVAFAARQIHDEKTTTERRAA